MNQIKTIDGHLNAADLKFAILATRFNDFIVDRLVGGAVLPYNRLVLSPGVDFIPDQNGQSD